MMSMRVLITLLGGKTLCRTLSKRNQKMKQPMGATLYVTFKERCVSKRGDVKAGSGASSCSGQPVCAFKRG